MSATRVMVSPPSFEDTYTLRHPLFGPLICGSSPATGPNAHPSPIAPVARVWRGGRHGILFEASVPDGHSGTDATRGRSPVSERTRHERDHHDHGEHRDGPRAQAPRGRSVDHHLPRRERPAPIGQAVRAVGRRRDELVHRLDVPQPGRPRVPFAAQGRPGAADRTTEGAPLGERGAPGHVRRDRRRGDRPRPAVGQLDLPEGRAGVRGDDAASRTRGRHPESPTTPRPIGRVVPVPDDESEPLALELAGAEPPF